MESVKDILINRIENEFPNRFIILEDTISFGFENGYSVVIISKNQLYSTRQQSDFRSATCKIDKKTIYINSGNVDDIIFLLKYIK